jgi:hypothetical protein
MTIVNTYNMLNYIDTDYLLAWVTNKNHAVKTVGLGQCPPAVGSLYAHIPHERRFADACYQTNNQQKQTMSSPHDSRQVHSFPSSIPAQPSP